MIIHLIHKFLRRVVNVIDAIISKLYCYYLFKGNRVSHKKFKTYGIPYIMIARHGECVIGENFVMNNGIKGNPIGCYQPCTIFVDKDAKLEIGDNVGISETALICHVSLKIGNNVQIGGGVSIYDTDFHSINPEIRASHDDNKYKVKSPVVVGNNVFIGAHTIILKGVEIGNNSVIGAGSVVAKSIPANEIWAGNPAKFIKNLS